MSKHTHTPLPIYEKELTSAGLKVELVNDVIDGLKNSSVILDCPACKEPPKERDTPKEPKTLEEILLPVTSCVAKPLCDDYQENVNVAIANIKAWAESCLPEEDRYMKLEVCKFCGGMQYNCNCSWSFNSAIEKTRQNIRSSK